MAKTLDRIYQLVKKKKHVDIFTFCDLLDMSPSSFYNYKKFVLHRYGDSIIYDDNQLKWVESEIVKSNDNPR